MDSGAIFATAFLVGLSGAMMPGPLLTVTIGETARRGFRASLLIVFGHGLLEAALVLGLAAGLMVFLARTEVARVIALLGGGFLIYLGLNMVRDTLAGRVFLELGSMNNPVETGIEQASRVEKPERLALILAGILTSLSNPYWTLWWATIGLGYITLSFQKGYWGLTSFFSGHILADFAWYGMVAATVAGGRRFLSQKVYKGILVACGTFLIVLGGYFIFSALLSNIVI